MKTISTAIALLITALMVASCSHIQTRYYMIDTEPTVERVKKHLPLVVEVANVNSPSRYQDQMVYRTSGYEVGFYEYSKWAENPSDLVRITLINILRDSGLFQQVVPAGTIAAPDLTLRCTIARFDQDITKAGYFADCELMLNLITRGNGKSIWMYEAKGHVKQPGPGKFVPSMSEAVKAAIMDAVDDMEKSSELQKMAAEKKHKRRGGRG
jgi:ABC-type uncharacterized transport system auxiliary subunit